MSLDATLIERQIQGHSRWVYSFEVSILLVTSKFKLLFSFNG